MYLHLGSIQKRNLVDWGDGGRLVDYDLACVDLVVNSRQTVMASVVGSD